MHIHRAPTSHLYQWNVIWCFPMDVSHCAEAAIRKRFFDAIQIKIENFVQIFIWMWVRLYTLHVVESTASHDHCEHLKFGTVVNSRIITPHICWMLAVDGVRARVFVLALSCVLHCNITLCFVYSCSIRMHCVSYSEEAQKIIQRHMRARYFVFCSFATNTSA